MLEAAGQIPDSACELRLNTVVSPTRGRGVVRFVEDEEASWQHLPQPLPHRVRVDRVDQKVVEHEEAAVSAPRVDAKAPFAAYARQVGAIKDLKQEPEARFELGLPLFQNRGRRRDHDGLDLLAQQQLAGDEAGLDRFSEPRIIRDEQVDPRETECLPQRFHLVGVNLDAGAEGRLEEVRVSGCDAVPLECMDERRELARSVETPSPQVVPVFFLEDPSVELVVPEDVEVLALGVIVGAGKTDDG